MCFSAFSRSRPRWLAVLATHIPRRPKKKPLRGKKVGFAEKNCGYGSLDCIVCIMGGVSLPVGGHLCVIFSVHKLAQISHELFFVDFSHPNECRLLGEAKRCHL